MGRIVWLPDIYRWAEIVCHFLKPGGSLYLAEAHPVAMVFDDAAPLPDGGPGFFAPYFSRDMVVMEEAHDYIDETTTVRNATTYTWIHPLGDIISGLLSAGMTLDWLHEHDGVTWHMFDVLVRAPTGCGAGPIGPGCRSHSPAGDAPLDLDPGDPAARAIDVADRNWALLIHVSRPGGFR